MAEKVEEMGEGMQCSDHPNRNNPGGICAFCLQEKLGKLVSSSKSNSFFPIPPPSTSSSSSPSASATTNTNASASASAPAPSISIPFFAHSKKKVVSSDAGATVMLNRSRSVAVPRHFCSDDSPRARRGFWSFLHLSRRRAAKQPPGSPGPRKDDTGASTGDENEGSPNSSSHASFGRKVARSRSVGCGSRSFSGDFLERISTGLGDCALRRVESQREAKPKIVLHSVAAAAAADDRIKEKVKCGGIFGMMVGGGGGSSASSSYWVSDDFNGRISQGATPHVPHSRTRSWGWAFASPIRAFRPSSSSKSFMETSSIISNSNKANGLSTDGRRTTQSRDRLSNHSSNQHHHKLDTSPSLLVVRT